MSSPRIRPLLIAENANPEHVSVPLVGWSLATALQRLCGAHIVTPIRNRDAFLRAGQVEGRDFTAIDAEALSRRVMKLGNALRMGSGKGWTIQTALYGQVYYPRFERMVWDRFGPEIESGRYNLVHRITPLSPTIFSPIAPRARRAGARFVMGPINGGVPWPPGFDAERRREHEWLSYVRGAYKLLPGRGATLKAADAIIAASRHTLGEFPAGQRAKCVYIPENAVDPARFPPIERRAPGDPLRGCFIGRIVPYKGLDMLLEAAAPLLRAGRLTLDVVGDGPSGAAARAQAAALGVAERVVFHGLVPHERVREVAAPCDLFLFPSVREFGGGVVLEAMAMGLTPVVVDYGGPGELVTVETGYRIPIGRREEIVAALRDRLERIVTDPAPLPAKAAAGRRRVEALFTWDRKAEQVMQVYEWAMGQRAERPDPFGVAG